MILHYLANVEMSTFNVLNLLMVLGIESQVTRTGVVSGQINHDEIAQPESWINIPPL